MPRLLLRAVLAGLFVVSVPLPTRAQVDFCKRIVQIPLEECRTLEAFYVATNGPNWDQDHGWFREDEPCYWMGLACTTWNWPRRITRIRFVDNNLEGVLPAGLNRLKFLRELTIENRVNSDHHGNLTSSIPAELSELERLEVIRLGRNSFVGGIPPEFVSMKNLRVLDLAENNLDGYIPPLLLELSTLEELNLSRNNLQGPLLPALGNLRNLRMLDLSANQFSGTIPETIGELDSLTVLDLSSNRLSGPIPGTLGDLQELFSLNLSENDLRGSVPESFTQMGGLVVLNLSGNRLAGPIDGPPAQFLGALPFCDLSKNDPSLCLADPREVEASVCGLDRQPDCGSAFGNWISGIQLTRRNDQPVVSWTLSPGDRINSVAVVELNSVRTLVEVEVGEVHEQQSFHTPLGELTPGNYELALQIRFADGTVLESTPIPLEVLPRELVVDAYPNPARAVLRVEIASMKGGPIQLELVDMTGRSVRSLEIEVPPNGIARTIPISGRNLAAGAYQLRARDENGSEDRMLITVVGGR